MGLDHHRDRLCVVQLSPGDGTADVVQIPRGNVAAVNLKTLLTDPNILKIFHFARFDLGVLQQTFGVMPDPVYCTKIASRLVRTYTDKHGLKDLTRDLLGIEVSKQQQLTDWGADDLTEAQLAYAASDVLHLHALKKKLEFCLRARAGRNSQPPVSGFYPIGFASIWPGGPQKTSSPTADRRPAVAIFWGTVRFGRLATRGRTECAWVSGAMDASLGSSLCRIRVRRAIGNGVQRIRAEPIQGWLSELHVDNSATGPARGASDRPERWRPRIPRGGAA